MIKILGINGSPRADGNAAYALRYYLEQFSDGRYCTELLNVDEVALIPCKSCMRCREKKDGQCIFTDDSGLIYCKMQEADVIVLASPVYMGSISPQLLALLVKVRFLDRSLRRFEGKIGVPIIVGRRSGHNFAFSQFLQFFFLSGMTIPGSRFWNVLIGNNEKGTVRKDVEGLSNLKWNAENVKQLVKDKE